MAPRQAYADDDSFNRVDTTPPEQEKIAIDQLYDEKGDLAHQTEVVDAAVHQLTEKLGDRDDGLAPSDDIAFVMDKIAVLTVAESQEILKTLLEEHEYDYNLGDSFREKAAKLIQGPSEGQSPAEWELELKTEAAVCKYYSPYPEIRAITTPDDDPSIHCETIRAHLLGYLWAAIAQFTNSLFSARYPQINITSVVVQLLLYPSGLLVALVLPDWGFNFLGNRVSLNSGPWTYKEQMLSTIIVDVGLVSAYCFSNIQTQTVYYHDTWLTPGYGILLLLSTQLMGLGFSGLIRRYVVYPIEALWPNVFPTIALNKALLLPEKQETVHGWSISRYRLFFIAFSAMFVYYWLPGYLFPALSAFAWMTWIRPANFPLNIITGSQTGMGFNPWATFDWNVLSTYSLPLAYPFFATCQQYIGTALAGIIIIAIYWTNVKWTAYLPINSSDIFDNTGQSYNISRVVSANSGTLDEEAYQKYSPAFYTAANLVSYGAFFAFYPLTMVFIVLDAWRPLVKAYRTMAKSFTKSVRTVVFGTKNVFVSLSRGRFGEAGQHIHAMFEEDGSVYDGFDDPLTNLLRAYPEVPDWWFLAIALISFVFAIVILEQWKELDTPVWTIFFVIGLNLIFLIPMSYLYAISGNTEGLNVITELIVGYALPGHPEALMFVKAYGYNINGQADTYLSDQKLGYYSKLPPRAMYRGQILSAIITAIVCYGTVQFADNDIKGMCTPDQPQDFNCANGSQIYFSSSVIWGAIGPQRIFSQIYPALKWTFLLGFLLALLWWGLKRYGALLRSGVQRILPAAVFKPLDTVLFTPISWLKHVHPSLVINGMLVWAPLNLSYYTQGLYISFLFMWWLKRYKTSWWERYTYTLSAALSGGVAFSAIIVFFSVEYHPKVLNWWGTDILGETIDGGVSTINGVAAQQALITQLPAKGYFGPDKWF